MSVRAPGHGAERVPPPGALVALGVAVALPATVASAGWILGQLLADRWAWAQWLFWTPPWTVATGALAGALAARAWLPRGPVAGIAAWTCAVACAWSCGRFALTDVGWRSAVQPGPGDITVTHWNPQWPGEDALGCGRSLAPVLGDVAVVSGPGSMLRFDARSAWLPPGYVAHDHGMFGVVSRLPVVEHRTLGSVSLPDVGTIWMAWVVVRTEGGEELRILALDLPSSPRRARGTIASGLAAALAGVRLPAAPDLVLGDLNCTPGSVILPVAAPTMSPAPPWRSSGWLCTYRRPWPVLRIDHMLAGRRVQWVGYRTVDLGYSDHRAQVGIVRLVPGTP
jgi:hypothetical protein